MDCLKVSEVAELKGCTPQYLRKVIKDGKLSIFSGFAALQPPPKLRLR